MVGVIVLLVVVILGLGVVSMPESKNLLLVERSLPRKPQVKLFFCKDCGTVLTLAFGELLCHKCGVRIKVRKRKVYL